MLSFVHILSTLIINDTSITLNKYPEGLQDGSTYVAPYYVRLDCGGKQVCNIESFFEKLDETPMKAVLQVWKSCPLQAR